MTTRAERGIIEDADLAWVEGLGVDAATRFMLDTLLAVDVSGLAVILWSKVVVVYDLPSYPPCMGGVPVKAEPFSFPFSIETEVI